MISYSLVLICRQTLSKAGLGREKVNKIGFAIWFYITKIVCVYIAYDKLIVSF